MNDIDQGLPIIHIHQTAEEFFKENIKLKYLISNLNIYTKLVFELENNVLISDTVTELKISSEPGILTLEKKFKNSYNCHLKSIM